MIGQLRTPAGANEDHGGLERSVLVQYLDHDITDERETIIVGLKKKRELYFDALLFCERRENHQLCGQYLTVSFFNIASNSGFDAI